MGDSAIGFESDIKSKEDEILAKTLKNVEPHDLVKFGIIPELVGRIPIITALDGLDEDALVRILTEPKNALVKQYQKLFSYDGTRLEFTDDALHAIAKKALERKTGARGLRGILEDNLSRLMFELPSANAESVKITAEVINSEEKLNLNLARRKKLVVNKD